MKHARQAPALAETVCPVGVGTYWLKGGWIWLQRGWGGGETGSTAGEMMIITQVQMF